MTTTAATPAAMAMIGALAASAVSWTSPRMSRSLPSMSARVMRPWVIFRPFSDRA